MYMYTENLRSNSRQKTSHVAMSYQCTITPKEHGHYGHTHRPLMSEDHLHATISLGASCCVCCPELEGCRYLGATDALHIIKIMETSVGACSSVHNLVEVCCW